MQYYLSFPVLIFAVLMLAIALYVYYQVKYIQIRYTNGKAGNLFSSYLESAKVGIWGYHVSTGRFFLIDSNGVIDMDYTKAMFSVFYNAEDYADMLAAIDKIVGGEKESASLQVRCFTNDNVRSERICRLRISVKEQHWGKPHVLLGVQQDVTEDHRKEKALMEEHAKFHAIFDTMMLDVLYFDKDGVLSDVNQHAMETFAIRDKKSLIERKLSIDNMPIHNSLVNDGHWTCTIADFSEFRHFDKLDVDKRDKTMYYESMALPIYNLERELVGRIEVGYDITAVVENIRKIRRQINKLATRTAYLDRVVQSVDTVLLESKIYRAHYDVSTRCLKFDNWRTGKPLVMSELDCVYMVGLEWRSKMMRVFKHMSKGAKRQFNIHFGTMFKESGSNMYFNFQAVPRYDSNGDVMYYYCMLHDETERIEIDKVAAQERKEAQEAEQLHSLFMHNISYEIRTPLNSIIGFSELLEQDHDAADEPLFVEEIRRNTDNLLNMVNDVLTLSRLEAGMQETNQDTTDVVGLFGAQCHAGCDTLLKPGVQMIVECPYSMLYGMIDANNLGIVLYNFCMLSAIKTNRGYIKATLAYHSNRLFITIADTGMGFRKGNDGGKFITAQQQNRDYRTELKLMICVQLIQMMGGTFDVESKVGEGTTVWIEIPFKSMEAVRAGDAEAAAHGDMMLKDDELSVANNDMMIGGGDLISDGGSFLDTIY